MKKKNTCIAKKRLKAIFWVPKARHSRREASTVEIDKCRAWAIILELRQNRTSRTEKRASNCQVTQKLRNNHSFKKGITPPAKVQIEIQSITVRSHTTKGLTHAWYGSWAMAWYTRINCMYVTNNQILPFDPLGKTL